MRRVGLSSVCCVALLGLPTTALAYLDPGTGNVLLQTVLGALAAIAFAIKVSWERIRSLFSRRRDRQLRDDPPSAGRSE
jgi:hypothetical protein